MISAGDFRNGVTLEIDGQVVQILEFQHVKPGKGAAFVRTKLKNVINGGVVERTFRPTEKFPQARIERVDMQYLYSDGDLFYFMNVENYEQIALNEETIGDALKFVKENEMVKVCSYNGNVFAIEPPLFVELEADAADDVPNVAFYQNELDRRMQYLADLGFVNALGFAWSGSIEQGVEHQKHLARYIIARYGALPVVWTLAGEVAGYFPGEPRERAIKGWREVAEYVEEMDGYDTLQTAHYTNERPFADYYYDEPWFDFVLNQAGHGDFPINVSWYRSYQKEHGTKPFIEGESLYEYCSTLEENGTRLCTDAMLRRVAYMAIQTGGCGYTYGAQGIWDNIWEVSDINPYFNAFNKFGITWAKAIDGPGGAQMGYLKRFYEEHHFEEMVPYDPAEAEENISPFSNKLAAATISRDKTRALIYYGEMDGMSTRIAGLCDGIYAVSWFDPRTGETEKAEEQVEVRQESCIMPKKPAAGDWMLIAECIEKTEK